MSRLAREVGSTIRSDLGGNVELVHRRPGLSTDDRESNWSRTSTCATQRISFLRLSYMVIIHAAESEGNAQSRSSSSTARSDPSRKCYMTWLALPKG